MTTSDFHLFKSSASLHSAHSVRELEIHSQLQSVAISDFHLYVGSSNGRIVVFSLGRVCQRPEKHRCHLYDEPQWFCEQVGLECSGDPHTTFEILVRIVEDGDFMLDECGQNVAHQKSTNDGQTSCKRSLTLRVE